LIIAAAARTFLQISAMPPYAGLDEAHHAARLAFTGQEHRSPDVREPSVPPYLHDSIHQVSGALPSFAHVARSWPQVVRENNRRILTARPFEASDLRPYREPNYEAQQPVPYYALFGSMHGGSAIDELRRWRMSSAALAVVIVIATAAAGEALFGLAGIPVAAMLFLLPTWSTLVLRAGSDALACALVACAFAITVRAPQRIPAWAAEALLWGAALATKLYTWPLAVVVPLLWRRQKASRARIAIVTAVCFAAVLLTMIDLRARTTNALGSFNYEPVVNRVEGTVNWGEIVRVTIASAAWTSGQHLNALTPLAIAIYLGPVALALVAFVLRRRRPEFTIAFVILAAFAAGQAFNILRCIMAGRYAIPIGKEGWYWYAAAPLVIAVLLPPLVQERPKIFVAMFAWLLLWDVVISEGALFHDYSGDTSPASPTRFFRWGPFHVPFTADLRNIAVGPGERFLTELRIVTITAIVAGAIAYLRRNEPRESGTNARDIAAVR
jgi:hypothetical protein